MASFSQFKPDLPFKYCRESVAGASVHNLMYIAEVIVIQKHLVRAALVVVLCAALATPARADLQSRVDNDIVAGVVVAVAVVVVAAVLIVHYSKKRAITGCVTAGPNGMTVTDEKDRQIYALSGNTAGITPGDRMRLRGKKIKSKGPDKTLLWEARDVARDFGVCQP